jgi:hypothetical protein
MSPAHSLSHDLRMFFSTFREDKECGLGIELVEGVENIWRDFGIRAVVECEMKDRSGRVYRIGGPRHRMDGTLHSQ